MPTVPARSQRKGLKGAQPKAIAPPTRPQMPQPQGPVRRPQMGPASLPAMPSTPQQMPIPPQTRVSIPPQQGAGHMSNAKQPLGKGGVGAGQAKKKRAKKK